jgi:hypothetical protein
MLAVYKTHGSGDIGSGEDRFGTPLFVHRHSLTVK